MSATDAIIEALLKKSTELNSGFPIAWRYPETPAADPLAATPDPAWLAWDQKRMPLRKNEKHWVYGELAFPEAKCGIPLAGTDALLHIWGWCPFTLWLDGEECFKETHAWNATGPIAAPLPFAIRPGQTHRLVVCLDPTEIPSDFNPLAISVGSKPCAVTAIELAAAAAELRFASELAATPQERQLVERAARALNAAAIEVNDWPALMASIDRMERTLQPLSARARKHTVHLLGHSHIDMDWMWTWKDTVHCMRRDFKAVTDLMDDYPDLTFAISQISSYEVAQQYDPDVFAKVKARIAEGRWENVAGTWVEGDLHMADGESIARQMLYAADWTREHLGSKARTLWEPDTFGHPGNMPQLARLGEFDHYFHWRCNPGRHHNWPVRTWEGIDGSRVPAVSMAYGSDLHPLNLVNAALAHRRFKLKNSLHIWGMGDHGGALSRHWLQMLSLFRHKPLLPTIRFNTLAGFMDAVRKSKVKLPRNRGETYSLFEGCWTTHAGLKKENRECEGALLAAEALAALAGLDRRAALRAAWTPVLFNQFHDLLDGSAVQDAYADASRRSAESLRAARAVAAEAAAVLTRPSDAGKTLVLLNPLGFDRTEPIRVHLPAGTTHLVDDRGAVVPVQKLGEEFVFVAERVPAFGSRSYSARRTPIPKPAIAAVAVSDARDYGEQGETFRIETAHAVLRIAKGSGVIGSYFDKRLERELVAFGVPKFLGHVQSCRADLALNVFQLLDEAPNPMSAWHINSIRREENLIEGAEVALVETGPVFARFRVVHKFRSSRIEEEILCYHCFPRIDFVAVVDWREKGSPQAGVPQLKVSFGSAATRPRVRFEGPFCIAERPMDGTEQPTQKWLDLGGDAFGFTLLNDNKYGGDVLGSRLRLTLLRNGYAPDPESDNGVHTIRFAFAPHGPAFPAAELVRSGMAFNRPMIAVPTSTRPERPTRGLLLHGADSVVCTSLRLAEHSDGTLLRFFETEGQTARIRFRYGRGVRRAEEVNFLENPTGGSCVVRGGVVHATLKPFEVKTLLLRG